MDYKSTKLDKYMEYLYYKFRFIREKVEQIPQEKNTWIPASAGMTQNRQLRLSSSGLTRGSRVFPT